MKIEEMSIRELNLKEHLMNEYRCYSVMKSERTGVMKNYAEGACDVIELILELYFDGIPEQQQASHD
jgi:hypothetical protein